MRKSGRSGKTWEELGVVTSGLRWRGEGRTRDVTLDLEEVWGQGQKGGMRRRLTERNRRERAQATREVVEPKRARGGIFGVDEIDWQASATQGRLRRNLRAEPVEVEV